MAQARQPALADLGGVDAKKQLQKLAEKDNIDVATVNATIREMTAATKSAALSTATPSTKEISPEAWLFELKTRFDELSRLHPEVEWADVEKALKASPEAMQTLMKLDQANFEMNVFHSEDPNFIQFRMAQTDVTKIAAKYRDIMYDRKAEIDLPSKKTNGNAVDLAAALDCELADSELYEQLMVRRGWVWLQTATATRIVGGASGGDCYGICNDLAFNRYDYGSFCAALRVKKV